MSAERPLNLPEWATNLNFASPGDPWDTDPTKVAPSAGKQAEGWEPTEVPPAEFFNWWQNLVGQWISNLSDLEWRNWVLLDQTDSGISSSGITAVQGVFASSDGGTGSTPLIVMIGNEAGDNNIFALSPTGDEWTVPAANPAFAVPRDVMFSGVASLWIASGVNANGIMTAPLGAATWTLRTDPSGTTGCEGLAEGAGLIVAVKSNNAPNNVITSANGTTWTSRSTPAGENYTQVAFGNSLFVAVGQSGVIATSPDGITWTSRTSGTANSLQDVVYDSQNGLWIAVGNNATILTSPDGITWTSRTAPAISTSTIISIDVDGRGSAIALASATSENYGATFLMRSTDGGVTWTGAENRSVLGVNGPGEDIHWARSFWLVTGSSGSAVYIAQSLRSTQA